MSVSSPTRSLAGSNGVGGSRAKLGMISRRASGDGRRPVLNRACPRFGWMAWRPLHDGYGGGTMLMHPGTFAGHGLALNYATSAAECVRVELLDGDGQALPPLPGLPRVLPNAGAGSGSLDVDHLPVWLPSTTQARERTLDMLQGGCLRTFVDEPVEGQKLAVGVLGFRRRHPQHLLQEFAVPGAGQDPFCVFRLDGQDRDPGTCRLRMPEELPKAGTIRPVRRQKSARFPESVANCITSSRAFRVSGPAPAEPSGRNSKIESLRGS